MPMRRLLAASLIPLLAGCYTYRTVPTAGLGAQQEVTVWVNEQGSTALTPVIGPRAHALEGVVASRSDSTVTVALNTVTRRDGSEQTMARDLVTVPVTGIDSASLRRFDRKRTILMASGVVVGAVLIRFVAEEAGFTRSSGGKPAGTQ